MKTQSAFIALALLAAPMLVHASCDAVKASIDAKLKAKGLQGYTLTVVPHDQPVTDGKVVGQCRGDKQIVYTRGAPTDEPAPSGNKSAHHPHAKAKMGTKPDVAPTSSSGTPPQSDEPHPAIPSSSGG